MSDFKCPLCLQETESQKIHKTIQLYSKGTEHAVCDSCAEVVAMLRAGSIDDVEVIPVRLSLFQRSLLERFVPFWGRTDAEVIKTLALRWIEANFSVPGIMHLCEINEKVKGGNAMKGGI